MTTRKRISDNDLQHATDRMTFTEDDPEAVVYEEMTRARESEAALLERVERLETFARDCCNNFDCDRDAHKYGTMCRACSALAALTTEKETT